MGLVMIYFEKYRKGKGRLTIMLSHTLIHSLICTLVIQTDQRDHTFPEGHLDQVPRPQNGTEL